MKPIPPISAAKAYASLMPVVARRQSCQFRKSSNSNSLAPLEENFGMLQVDSPDPVSLRAKKKDEMVSDEATCASYQNANLTAQCDLS